MNLPFEGCENLTGETIKDWNTSKVKVMKRMFKDCRNLKVEYLKNWDLSSLV